MGNRVNIYITADNIISALGFGTEENLEAIRSYHSGISLQTDNRISDTPVYAATINNSRLKEECHELNVEGFTRVEQLFILSLTDVLNQSGVRPGDPDCGIIFASTKGNIELLQDNTDYPADDISLWQMAGKVASHFGWSSGYRVVSNACISGVSALVIAKRWLECGKYKRLLVTGADVLSHFITSGFISFKSVSRHVCRPYDRERDGLSLGEGCGTLLLSTESSGNNDIILAGGSITNDANHISGPSRTGDGLSLAIDQAMNEAAVDKNEIGFINAHGTATLYNDDMESKAIHRSGLEHAPVNSLKSYFGHTLGAAGIIETIVCAHCLKDDILFGTYGFRQPGLAMPLRISAEHIRKKSNACVKTASGFGGCNAAIVLTKSPVCTNAPYIVDETPVKEVRRVVIENHSVQVDNRTVLADTESDFHTFIRQAYKASGDLNTKFYKMSDLSKLGYVASCYLMDGFTFQPHQAGIVLANANSSLGADRAHQHNIQTMGDAGSSPSVFVYTLPNVVSGEICIRHKIQGENTFFINKISNFDELEAYAALVVRRTNLKYCIVGWCEQLNEHYRAEFRLLESTK